MTRMDFTSNGFNRAYHRMHCESSAATIVRILLDETSGTDPAVKRIQINDWIKSAGLSLAQAEDRWNSPEFQKTLSTAPLPKARQIVPNLGGNNNAARRLLKLHGVGKKPVAPDSAQTIHAEKTRQARIRANGFKGGGF